MVKKRIGTIITPPGAFVELHEKITADYLAFNLGKDVTFLVPDRRKGIKTPDIFMDGVEWEIKAPFGRSSGTINNILRRALEKSPYIVLDLRRMDGRIPTNKLVREAERQFNLTKGIKHLMVITRQETHLDFVR